MAQSTQRVHCGEHWQPLLVDGHSLIYCAQGCEISWDDLEPQGSDKIHIRAGSVVVTLDN